MELIRDLLRNKLYVRILKFSTYFRIFIGFHLNPELSLKKLFWDYEFSEKELRDLLDGKVEYAGHLDRLGLYSRMLSSLGWYSILDLVGIEHIEELLSDSVLMRIHSKDLKSKYAAAKRIL